MGGVDEEKGNGLALWAGHCAQPLSSFLLGDGERQERLCLTGFAVLKPLPKEAFVQRAERRPRLGPVD